MDSEQDAVPAFPGRRGEAVRGGLVAGRVVLARGEGDVVTTLTVTGEWPAR
ncbi:hypothetical protein [Streptomyces sp. NPDC088261]|uniref:hypothetical protein n=1 Tax=Streptomyces sp. NPDC088261 TaxID=3365851 RepID=UPI0038097D12